LYYTHVRYLIIHLPPLFIARQEYERYRLDRNLVVTLSSLDPTSAANVARVDAFVEFGAIVGCCYSAADLLSWAVLVNLISNQLSVSSREGRAYIAIVAAVSKGRAREGDGDDGETHFELWVEVELAGVWSYGLGDGVWCFEGDLRVLGMRLWDGGGLFMLFQTPRRENAHSSACRRSEEVDARSNKRPLHRSEPTIAIPGSHHFTTSLLYV